MGCKIRFKSWFLLQPLLQPITEPINIAELVSHQLLQPLLQPITEPIQIAEAVSYELIPGSDSMTIIDNTIKEIEQLSLDGDLNTGNVKSLVSKLENAAASFEKDKIKTTINQLNAFINQIDALVQSKKLDQATGQSLIDDIKDVIDSLTP